MKASFVDSSHMCLSLLFKQHQLQVPAALSLNETSRANYVGETVDTTVNLDAPKRNRTLNKSVPELSFLN